MSVTDFEIDVLRHFGLMKDRVFENYEVLKLNDVKFEGISAIVFENCEFKLGVSFESFNNPEVGLDFRNCRIPNTRRIHISKCQVKYLSFTNCTISQINANKLEIENSIHLSSAKDLKLVRFAKVKSPSLDINCNLSGIDSLILNNKEIEETTIFATNKINELRINEVSKLSCSGQFGKVIIDSGDFKSIEFCSTVEGEIEIKTEIDNLGVYSAFFGGILILNGLNINKLNFESVSSQNGVFLCNDAFITNAGFYNTNLKNISWNNVHFKECLNISNSDFSGLKYANINWIPKTKFSCVELQYDTWFYGKSEKETILKEITELTNDREVYRQLKAAATSCQNHIDALEFYRLEMRLYWKEVRFTKKIHKKDRWLVLINRIVSDFGQNWLLPLLWLFGIHYLLFMSIYEWDYSLNWNDFKNGLGSFFELLNPVHKTPDYINTGMGLFTEFWMRILSGFFIYHFVKATRKYGKI